MRNNNNWIQTYLGYKFWPTDPDIDDINITDIASALSKICRFCGHGKRFYSVAEHCVLVASMAPVDLKLTALMHDASEAYLGDVTRPLKESLPQYKVFEHNLMAMISRKFGLIWPEPIEIKSLDVRILRDERDQGMRPTKNKWTTDEQGERLGVTLKFWSPEVAFLEFLTAFFLYGG